MALKVPAQKAAEIAIGSIGRGYDLARDLRLKYCSGDAKDLPLIEFDEVGCYDVALPGGISISNVSKLIKCNQGEAMRIGSDVTSFQQVNLIVSAGQFDFFQQLTDNLMFTYLFSLTSIVVS